MTERFVKIKTRINEESQIKIDNKFISMRIENVYIKEEFYARNSSGTMTAMKSNNNKQTSSDGILLV